MTVAEPAQQNDSAIKTNGNVDHDGLASGSSSTSSSYPLHPNTWYRQDFGGYRVSEQPLYSRRPLKILATGAGATGIMIAYKVQKHLQDVELVVYEKNHDIGGAWLENRYPGCACDVPSHSYQFPWNPNPEWSSYYSPATEIWQYFKDTVAKFDLEKYMRFNHKVLSATWDDDKAKWLCEVQRPDGTLFVDEADILLGSNGLLNKWKWPDIPGRDTFKGILMHSAAWDTEVDLQGKVVAVIGAGSSGIQIVPNIRPVVKHLKNFVRSPIWLTSGFAPRFAGPDGNNFQYDEETKKKFREDPEYEAAYCRKLELEMISRYPQFYTDSLEQQRAVIEATEKMKRYVMDPAKAEKLIPKFPVGCRRISPGNAYFEAFTHSNAELVTSGVATITPSGVVDEDGKEHPVDVIICATGFDTSYSPSYTVRGRNSLDLRTAYGDCPKTYLGIMVPDFPNFFSFLGPNSPVTHGSLFGILEWHLRYSIKVIQKLQRENIKAIAPQHQAADDYFQHTHEMMKRLVFSSPCSSWLKNGKSHGPVIAQYTGSRLHYSEATREPRYEDFEIEYLTKNRFQYLGNGFTQLERDGKGDLTWFLSDPDL
ncbi:hypothetical protein IWW34DRAFT_837550 [Fusarium oxysporum f. sp. albedinis]|nr:hypothetical protein IWW34DRAFT_837550 [Fusarium oxysporum f. sp. albedinis]